MTKKSVKLPRMTEQQVTVMCHLALGSRITRHRVRHLPRRYEYPLFWVPSSGPWQRHGRVSAKTINALVRKNMVHFRDGEIRAFKKVLGLVVRQLNKRFQQVQESRKRLDEMLQEDQTKEQIETREAVDEREGKAEEQVEENLDPPRTSIDYDRAYSALANRLMSAFGAVNSALQEAFKMDIMTVKVGTSHMDEDGPTQFYPQVFRRTHAQMEWRIKMKARVAGGPPLVEAERVPV